MSAYDEAGEWSAAASTRIGCKSFFTGVFFRILLFHDTSLFMYTLSGCTFIITVFLYGASMEIYFLCIFLPARLCPERIAPEQPFTFLIPSFWDCIIYLLACGFDIFSSSHTGLWLCYYSYFFSLTKTVKPLYHYPASTNHTFSGSGLVGFLVVQWCISFLFLLLYLLSILHVMLSTYDFIE